MREWLRIVPETINFIRFHNNISIKLRTFVTFEIPIASCSDQTDSFIASGFIVRGIDVRVYACWSQAK